MIPSTQFSKIIFLDIDGVLNTGNHEAMFNPSAVAQFNRILQETGCGIVVSSSWRIEKDIHGVDFVEIFSSMIPLFSERYIGDTPDLSVPVQSSRYSEVKHYSYVERGREIQKWLDDNNYIGKFAIVDDAYEMLHLTPYLFLTPFYIGISEEIANRIIDHLNS